MANRPVCTQIVFWKSIFRSAPEYIPSPPEHSGVLRSYKCLLRSTSGVEIPLRKPAENTSSGMISGGFRSAPELFLASSGSFRSCFWLPPESSGKNIPECSGVDLTSSGMLRRTSGGSPEDSGVEIIPPEAFRRYLLRNDFRSPPECSGVILPTSGALRSAPE